MKFSHDFPPNIKDIRTALDLTSAEGRVVFTYGDTLYNPYKLKLDDAVIAHERLHMKQQEKIGVEEWWRRYLAEPEFRAREEIAAYRVHYRALKRMRIDKATVSRIIHGWAAHLAGAMYGECMTLQKALHKIKVGI